MIPKHLNWDKDERSSPCIWVLTRISLWKNSYKYYQNPLISIFFLSSSPCWSHLSPLLSITQWGHRPHGLRLIQCSLLSRLFAKPLLLHTHSRSAFLRDLSTFWIQLSSVLTSQATSYTPSRPKLIRIFTLHLFVLLGLISFFPWDIFSMISSQVNIFFPP